MSGSANTVTSLRLRLVERVTNWMERPLAPLQLKSTDLADRPLTAKGGRKVVIQLGDERIEYSAGMTKVEGRITPAAQDALEPKLEALGKERDEGAARIVAAFSASMSAAKAAYEKACADADAARKVGIDTVTGTYERAAREAIMAASAGTA